MHKKMSGKLFLILACATIMAQAERRQVVPEPRQSLVSLDTVVSKPAASRLTFSAYTLDSVNSGVYYQSSNYPNAYPSNVEGGLLVSSPVGSVINIYCAEFNVETSTSCNKDGLQLGLQGQLNLTAVPSYCGQGTLNKTSTTNALSIAFYSGARVNSAVVFKWKCLLTAVAQPATATGAAATTTTAAPTAAAAATTTTAAPTTAASGTTVAGASTCSCGVRGSSALKIVNGTLAGVQEFPWRCNLRMNGNFFCGASIIDNSWILTAAHCTNAVPAGTPLDVVCGDYDVTNTTGSVITRVDKIIQHAQYNTNNQDNDMSLLHLSKPLTYSPTISPVCLPFANQGNNCDTAGTSVTASGWGTTSAGGSISNLLLKVDLPCIGTTACQKYYGTSVTSNMLCTYSPGKDTCQGDSGGSIDYLSSNGRYYGIGVVSWGVGCAGVNNPGVYAKVTNYLSWIQTNTNANFCKP